MKQSSSTLPDLSHTSTADLVAAMEEAEHLSLSTLEDAIHRARVRRARQTNGRKGGRGHKKDKTSEDLEREFAKKSIDRLVREKLATGQVRDEYGVATGRNTMTEHGACKWAVDVVCGVEMIHRSGIEGADCKNSPYSSKRFKRALRSLTSCECITFAESELAERERTKLADTARNRRRRPNEAAKRARDARLDELFVVVEKTALEHRHSCAPE